MKKVVATLTGLLGAGLIIAAIVYGFLPARSLPRFMPGYDRTLTRMHYKHAAISLVVGVGLLMSAWRLSRKRGNRRDRDRIFGWFVGWGLGRSHSYLLQVQGRKSGRVYSVPVNVLIHGDGLYLVARHGNTPWVRNALTRGHVTLKRGRMQEPFQVRAVPNPDKPEVLKAYVDRFKRTAPRYFPVPAGSAVEAFVPLVERYPVFELLQS